MSSARRPLVLQHKRRPSSAVFIGSIGSESLSSNLPDLPGPPSPETTSNDGSSGGHSSGLPSPPATNSTGSGSTGDKSSISARNQRPISLDMFEPLENNNNYNNDNATASSASAHHDFDDDNDEDDTARLGRRGSVTSDNESALQRVKSLTQRNRMVLDKLSSFSRTNSPNPSARSSLAPRSVASTSTASSSNSRKRHERTTSVTSAIYSSNHSGSETERDSGRFDYNSSVEDLSVTPPAPKRSVTPIGRARLQSAPSSPAKALLARAGQTVRTSTQRKRVSLADAPDYEDDELTRAALATVASARRSPNTLLGNGGTSRKRQPLPREFMDGGTAAGRFPTEPVTPHRDRAYERERTMSYSLSPHRVPLRSSTVRDLSRRHTTRWMSEDISAISSRDEEDYDAGVGRAQGTRGGSAESVLGQGRSLVGQGLRAAGIGVSQERDRDSSTVDDMFAERRHRVSQIDEEMRERSRSRLGGTFSRQSGSRAATSMADFRYREDSRRYDDEDDVNEAIPKRLRPFKSAYPLSSNDRDRVRDRERADSSLSRYPPPTDRGFTNSPFGSRRIPNGREVPHTPSSASTMEHTRLMTDALTMFETHFSRLPIPMHSNTAASEVLKNAQSVVDASDKLNAFLRNGSAKAMENHVNAEIGDLDDDGGESSKATAELWKHVSADYRDGLRLSDELVRGLTGFLLGVGKVMKDAVGDGGQFVHGRSVSLDESVTSSRTVGRMSLSPDVGGSGSGRRSVESRRSAESRRSWEPDDGRGPQNASGAPPPTPSSAARPRSNASGDSASRTSHGATGSGSSAASASAAARRTMTPQERRELTLANRTPDLMASVDSQATIHGYEPSPTPASRRQQSSSQDNNTGTVPKRTPLERSRSLAPLSIPPPLPTLPSEASAKTGSVRRSATVASADRKNATISRAAARTTKVSGTSTSTLRGTPKFNVSSSNTPTTAVTPHTVTNSPKMRAFPLSRTTSGASGSGSSARTGGGGDGVTFSRPSPTVSATLNGINERQGSTRRRASNASDTYGHEEEPPRSALMDSKYTGTATRTRRSLDGGAILQQAVAGTVGTGSRRGSPAVNNVMLPPTTGRSKERRRTITEIFS